MPDNPNTWWQMFLAAGGDLARHMWAIAMGFLGATLGFVYRHHSAEGDDVKPLDWRRLLLEGGTCGFIALTVSYGLEAAGLPVSMGNFLGGTLGFVGTKAASEWAVQFAKRKTGG